MTNALTVPEVNEQGLDAVQKAQSIQIASFEDYHNADLFCVGLKQLEKEVDDAFDEHIQAAFKNHRALVAKKKKFSEPIEEARSIVKAKLIAWDREQEKKRQEERSRLEAEAKKLAEERQIKAAAEAEKNGNKTMAEAILNAPTAPTPIVIADTTPKRQTHIRTMWAFEVTDATLVPREYLAVDEVKIGKVVRALGSATSIPGVRVFQRDV